jgi:hypothetical protein
MHFIAGGTIIGLLIAQPSGEGGAQAMLGHGWVRYVTLTGLLVASMAWWMRAQEGEENNIAAKILVGVGGLAILTAWLVPVNGKLPLLLFFEYFGKGEIEDLLRNIGMVLQLLLALIAILGVFVGPLARIGKVWGYLTAMWWAITLGLVWIPEAFGSGYVGSWKGRINLILRETAPSIICIAAAAWGLAYFLGKATSNRQNA